MSIRLAEKAVAEGGRKDAQESLGFCLPATITTHFLRQPEGLWIPASQSLLCEKTMPVFFPRKLLKRNILVVFVRLHARCAETRDVIGRAVARCTGSADIVSRVAAQCTEHPHIISLVAARYMGLPGIVGQVVARRSRSAEVVACAAARCTGSPEFSGISVHAA